MDEDFVVEAGGVRLGGRLVGDGAPVLLLHGGPGMGHEYLDSLLPELSGLRVATYQQRGLPPSQATGPYLVADHVADALRVLDALDWEAAVVVGHSWGGHLALHLARGLPDRCRAVLAVDPLGAVGDGGAHRFEAEMEARTPEADRRQAVELDERAMRGEGRPEDALESLRLFWPAYFASREAAPPMPDIRLAVEAYAATWESLVAELPALEAALPEISVPIGFVVGGSSPMPTSAAADSAARIPGAWVDVVDGAGHFVWLERPGVVRAALDRLLGR